MKIKNEILEKINELLSILDSQNASLKELNDKLEKIDTDISDIDSQKNEIQDNINSETQLVQSQQSAIQPLINTAEEEKLAAKQNHDNKLADLNRELDKINENEQAKTNLLIEEEKLNLELDPLNKKIEDHEANINAQTVEISTIEKQREE